MNNNEIVCCTAREDMLLCGVQTVPAGSAAGEHGSCGFEAGKLPQISFENQVYAEGYCPGGALTAGTLFPELADIYK